MTRTGLTAMTKLEVVVDASDVGFVEELFTAEGVSGWTSLSGLSGFGHHGRHEGRLLFNEQSGPTMLVTVLPDSRLEGVLAGLRAFFDDHAGVMFVSDTFVSRPDYFTAG